MKGWKWIAILGILLIICIVSSYFLLSGNQDAEAAQIISDGKILRTVNLNTDQEFTIPAANGGYNIVTVRNGQIAVTEASCPDHYCMKRGYCNSGTEIVCLPNRLSIRFLGVQEIDAIVG